ncbi:MAG: gfo/Idh/MocA family oxidoreductase, partial [Myxococcota bacterium]
PDPGPDFSVAVLFFESGMVARLTCSIIAPHDHSLRVIGDNGALELNEVWNNTTPVKFRKRFRVRRRLVESPLARRLKLPQPTHPKVGRTGAAAMNFALGPAEMLEAIAAGRASRLSGDFALHLTETTLAIQEAGETGAPVRIRSDCPRIDPMDWAR